MTVLIELTHPGEQLREVMHEQGWSEYKLVQLIGVPRSRMAQIAKGKRPITPADWTFKTAMSCA